MAREHILFMKIGMHHTEEIKYIYTYDMKPK